MGHLLQQCILDGLRGMVRQTACELQKSFLAKCFLLLITRFDYPIGEKQQSVAAIEAQLILPIWPAQELPENSAGTVQLTHSAIASDQQWRVMPGVAVRQPVRIAIEHPIEEGNELVFRHYVK